MHCYPSCEMRDALSSLVRRSSWSPPRARWTRWNSVRNTRGAMLHVARVCLRSHARGTTCTAASIAQRKSSSSLGLWRGCCTGGEEGAKVLHKSAAMTRKRLSSNYDRQMETSLVQPICMDDKFSSPLTIVKALLCHWFYLLSCRYAMVEVSTSSR